MVDIDDLKDRFLNMEFDTKGFKLDPERATKIALAIGNEQPCYTDPKHPELQATHALLASLASGRRLPIEFPKLGGMVVDGGKAVTLMAPVPVGLELTGRTHLHDIYDKTGRSGRMVFLVARMEIYGPDETQLAITDSRMVIREKPTS